MNDVEERMDNGQWRMHKNLRVSHCPAFIVELLYVE